MSDFIFLLVIISPLIALVIGFVLGLMGTLDDQPKGLSLREAGIKEIL